MKNPKVTLNYCPNDEDLNGQDLTAHINGSNEVFIEITIPNAHLSGWTCLSADTAELLGRNLIKMARQIRINQETDGNG